MGRRAMMVLASAALAGSLLITDAHARGGGGHAAGGGRLGGFARIHAGGYGEARVAGIRGGYISGIPRPAEGYAEGRRYGAGIRYGSGILRGRYYWALAAAELAQANSSTEADVRTTAPGAAQNPPVNAPSPQTDSGPGLTVVGRDGVSTKTVGMAPASSISSPSNTQNQAGPAFRSGDLVRLRSGGPLMTVEGLKGDQVDCFWTDFDGQIKADGFPADVLQKQ
jgi:uncharacterized protein YodC (DUF2158 family)